MSEDAWEPMCVYVHIYMGTQEGQMKVSGPQELELKAAVSGLVCTWNQILELWKSRKHS